jgi:iron complex transport system permease protein
MGSFAAKTWPDVALISGTVIIGMAVFVYYSRDLNLMALGQKSASSLGVDTPKVRLILLVTASLVSAICVSISGIIGFVGLLVPHIMRMFCGPDNRRLIPLALVLGALLLLAADTVTRAVLPYEVPIGVITALAGGPLFCYIFWKKQRMRGG